MGTRRPFRNMGRWRTNAHGEARFIGQATNIFFGGFAKRG